MSDAEPGKLERGALLILTDPQNRPRSGTGRKFVMGALIVGCLIMSVIGGLLPVLQGWIFFVIALYLLATEFEHGRLLVTRLRRRWPAVSRQIRSAAAHRWAPRHLREFERMTDPAQP